MDPRKLSIGGESPSRGSGRHETTPSSSNIITPSFSPQPSLPSIRQLHPYLPPSGLSQHLPQPGEGSGAMPMYPPHLVSQPGPSSQTVLGPRRSSEMFSMESEPEVGEESPEPPKKKRRRQALSCTECKRRKIKCDRQQPCTPCTRRGEQSRCQWHIVEPVEKYVTRAEFDDLKARYDELFEQVQRLQAATPVPSYYHMGITPGGLPGTSSEAVPPIVPLGYQPMIPPSQSYNLSTPSQGHQRFIKPEDTQTQSRHHQGATTSTSALTRSPTSLRPPPVDKSPTSTVAKASPYSLASITTPFKPDSQSKNCHAQTLVLGQRLRHRVQCLDNPATQTHHLLQGHLRKRTSSHRGGF